MASLLILPVTGLNICALKAEHSDSKNPKNPYERFFYTLLTTGNEDTEEEKECEEATLGFHEMLDFSDNLGDSIKLLRETADKLLKNKKEILSKFSECKKELNFYASLSIVLLCDPRGGNDIGKVHTSFLLLLYSTIIKILEEKLDADELKKYHDNPMIIVPCNNYEEWLKECKNSPFAEGKDPKKLILKMLMKEDPKIFGIRPFFDNPSFAKKLIEEVIDDEAKKSQSSDNELSSLLNNKEQMSYLLDLFRDSKKSSESNEKNKEVEEFINNCLTIECDNKNSSDNEKKVYEICNMEIKQAMLTFFNYQSLFGNMMIEILEARYKSM